MAEKVQAVPLPPPLIVGPARNDIAGIFGRMQPRCQRYRGGSHSGWFRTRYDGWFSAEPAQSCELGLPGLPHAPKSQLVFTFISCTRHRLVRATSFSFQRKKAFASHGHEPEHALDIALGAALLVVACAEDRSQGPLRPPVLVNRVLDRLRVVPCAARA